MKVTAIVPAYNEEKTIARVMSDLRKISFLTQIVIINDGSTDQTQEEIDKGRGGIEVISNHLNKGKGFSVAEGLLVAVGEIVLVLDGDIVNYTESDLKILMNPVVKGECDYTMKMTDDPRVKLTSGVRVYWKKDLMPLLSEMRHTTRYGLESLLNKRLSSKKGKFVQLKDYKHFQKFEKYPLLRALWEYLKEGLSINGQMVKNNFPLVP